MPTGIYPPTGVVTPGRSTRAHFDLPSYQRVENHWSVVRRGSEVASVAVAIAGGRDTLATERVRYWPGPKCWTLAPVQETMGAFQEALPINVNPEDIVISPSTTDLKRPSDEIIVAKIIERAIYTRPGNLPAAGGVYRPGVLSKGDIFFVKGVAAFGDYEGRINSAPVGPQVSGVPGLLSGLDMFAPPNAPMDTIYQPAVTFGPDQGFFLRWIMPGAAASYPDVVLNFYFGQYCLIIGGDGVAQLCEYSRPFGDGSDSPRWQRRTTFRYCRQGQVSNTAHSMLIQPLRDIAGGKWLVFRGNQVDTTPTLLTVSEPSIPSQDVNYHAEPIIRGNDLDESPASVTKVGPIRLDVRRDIKVGWQVTTLFYWAQGLIIDSLCQFPQFNEPRPVSYRIFGAIPDVPVVIPPSIGLTLWNNIGGGPWDGIDDPFAQILLTGGLKAGDTVDGATRFTPTFFGYALQRNAVIAATVPGAFTVPIDEFSGQSHCPDPRADKGEIAVHDLKSDFPRLRNRGHLDVKITTTALVPVVGGSDSQAEQAIVTLCRGQAVRTRRKRHGKPGQTQGGFAGGAARLYPDEEWSQFSAMISSMADRAREVHSGLIDFQIFLDDPDAPPDTSLNGNPVRPPWKVTDIIRYRLRHCGFSDAQLEIPDINIRLWSGFTDPHDSTYDTGSDQLDICVRLARTFLGAYLVWDTNAGPLVVDGTRPDNGSPEGAWRLVEPPLETDTPVYHFVAAPQKAGIRPPLVWQSYNDLTTWAEGPLESYTVPPEFNHVHVFTAPPELGSKGFRFDAHRYNPLSYQVPGMSVAPDPDSPHYIGRERLMIVPDYSLYVGGGTPEAYHRTSLAVNFTARRLRDFAGRAQRIQPLHAPLVVLKDSITGRFRTLRFGDPVTWRGESGWFIRSVNPEYTLDTNQMAHYELMQLVPI